MVVLRNGKQSLETGTRGHSEDNCVVPESKTARQTKKRQREHNPSPADKENVDPGPKKPDHAKPNQSGDGDAVSQYSDTENSPIDDPGVKDNMPALADPNHRKSAPCKKSKVKPEDSDQKGSIIEDDVKQDTKKRTRKDLEIEWNRTQLRDPRSTAERVVLSRRSEFDLTEEEKEFFKGPSPERPKKKCRLNAGDKEEMFREGAKNNVAHCFHELYVCFDKGPKGSPTYDESGFQLDYAKVADWMKPKAYNKRSMMNGMDKALARGKSESEKMAKAFFEGGKAPEGDEGHYTDSLVKDRVSKDLGIAWHKVTAAKVEEWAGKGFPKENPRDYVLSTVTSVEKKRLMSLLSGASLRK